MTTKQFKPGDCQQVFPWCKTISVHPGPFVVRVHESREIPAVHTPHRYFLSVDLKLKERDALGGDWWSGCTKAEATREANELAREIAIVVEALKATEVSSMPGKAALIQKHNERLKRLTGRYSATVEEA